MKEKLIQFFDTDFRFVEIGMRKETDPKRFSEIVWYARQRAVGAVDMAQLCGLSSKEGELMFSKYCARLEALKNEMCR